MRRTFPRDSQITSLHLQSRLEAPFARATPIGRHVRIEVPSVDLVAGADAVIAPPLVELPGLPPLQEGRAGRRSIEVLDQNDLVALLVIDDFVDALFREIGRAHV